MQRARRLQQLLVEIRAVGGVEVFYDHNVALLVDESVPRGCERVLEPDLRALSAALGPEEYFDGEGLVCVAYAPTPSPDKPTGPPRWVTACGLFPIRLDQPHPLVGQ